MGSQLDEYILEEFVGGGGMGAVFRATDSSLNRTVAVKVLTTRHGEVEDETKRFEQEAQSAARLNHENIAHVYGGGEDGGWQYIVFEFIPGKNLREFVNAVGQLSIEDTILLTLQIAAALEHASERDVVHRDIKPSNVIITEERQAKLVDMGLARLQQVDGGDDLTASGMTLGTFDYISPEQGADPKSADARSDLYSLGCTVFFMLTGQPPFPAGTPIQKILNHQNTPPPDLHQVRPDVPPGLIAIVERLLEKEPNDRFQSPRELIETIIAFADGRDIPVRRRPAKSDVHQSPFARHAEWLIPLTVLLVALIYVNQRLDFDRSATVDLPRFILPANSIANRDMTVTPLQMPSAASRNRNAPQPPARSHRQFELFHAPMRPRFQEKRRKRRSTL